MRVCSLVEFSIETLLSVHMAIVTGACKNTLKSRNEWICKRMLQAIKMKNLNSVELGEIKSVLNTAKHTLGKYPRSPEKHINMYRYLSKINTNSYDNYQLHANLSNSDLGRLSESVSELRRHGYHASIIDELASPILSTPRSKQMIIIRQHVEDAFDEEGALILPCSICVAGDYQPVVDVLHKNRLPIYEYQINKRNGTSQAHLQLHPRTPANLPLMQPSGQLQV